MQQWITAQSLEARDLLASELGRAAGAGARILREWGSSPWLHRTLDTPGAVVRVLAWRWVPSDRGCLWPVAAFAVMGEDRTMVWGIAPRHDRGWDVIPSLLVPERPMRSPLEPPPR